MFEDEKALVERYMQALRGEDGEFEPPLDFLADDFVYEIIGTTPVSGVMRGKEEVKEKLWDPFWERLDHMRMIPLEVVALEDGRVATFCTSEGRSRTGASYNQQYLYIYTVKDGKIVHIYKHCDTAMIETAIYGRRLVEGDDAADVAV